MLTNKSPEKTVNGIFSRVANKYDIMNDIISLGIQRKWRHTFLKKLTIQKGMRCLDLCCGTGAVTLSLARKTNFVVGLDFNFNMLKIAQKKIKESGLQGRTKLIKGDAMNLPFKNGVFDVVTIAFGLRNVPDAAKTIAEAFRVLKPNGKLAILEMSQPTNPVIKLGWSYYFKIFPYFAKLTQNRIEDYRYLAKTSAEFLSAERLKSLLIKKGFKRVEVTKLTWGVGAIHLAIK